MWNDCDCQRAMDRSHYWVPLDDPFTDSNFWGMPSAKRRGADQRFRCVEGANAMTNGRESEDSQSEQVIAYKKVES